MRTSADFRRRKNMWIRVSPRAFDGTRGLKEGCQISGSPRTVNIPDTNTGVERMIWVNLWACCVTSCIGGGLIKF